MPPSCKVCGKEQQILKRCTRCKDVLYWECQTKDWREHRGTCRTPDKARQPEESATPQEKETSEIWTDTEIDNEQLATLKEEKTEEIWTKTEVDNETKTKTSAPPRTEGSQTESSTRISYCRPVDFQTAFDNLSSAKTPLPQRNKTATGQQGTEKNGACENAAELASGEGKSYLMGNQVCTDVPAVDDTASTVTVFVKYDKRKIPVLIQETWEGADILKAVCSEIQVPLDKLKLVHKGRLVNADSVKDCVQARAVFQAIGEKAESEDGVNRTDIELIMKQLSVDRNTAVRALRNNDVIDAIMDISNR